jgi:3-oxoacyl-[acyl-carrier protein] reductase
MNLHLDGKVALVTGASRGLGRATALALAREGADVVIAARSQGPLDEVAEAIRRLGRRALAVSADVGSPEDREQLASQAIEFFGQVDVLVSNATALDLYGTDAPGRSFWDAHYNVDLLAAVHLTELLAPGMRRRHSGSIVFVSSISGKVGEGSDHAYGALKAALIAAGKTLATALAKDGIRVNVIAPGGMDEPGSEWERLRTSDPGRVAAIEKSIPMGRLGRPEEVADCITFLVSKRANWIVGHCLVVDGGQYPAVA